MHRQVRTAFDIDGTARHLTCDDFSGHDATTAHPAAVLDLDHSVPMPRR